MMPTLSGVITEAGSPVARTVRVYDHASGELVGASRSGADGAYSVEIPAGVFDVLFMGEQGREHAVHGPLVIQ